MPQTLTIKHIFRAHLLGPCGERMARGLLTVCQSGGHAVVYFDSHDGESPQRKILTGVLFATLDGDQIVTNLPKAERALGHVRFVVCGEPPKWSHRFEVYNRLPVPPDGSSIRTTVASVSARAKAVT